MILDGKALAKQNEIYLKDKVEVLSSKYHKRPSLKVILVGEEPASISYVTSKKKACERVGITCEIINLSTHILEDELINLIESINRDSSVDGLLVQMPLPKHIDEFKILNKVSPSKDVDGLTLENVGKLYAKQKGLVPATPKGVMMLLDHYQIEIEGKHAVVIGRSNLVGMPLAKLLLDRNATVTVLHSRSKNIESITKQADLLLVAIGKPNYITESMVKPGATVIDIGINRLNGSLVGDVDFNGVSPLCSYITPVPGGVGPMTISALLFNVIKQYEEKYHD